MSYSQGIIIIKISIHAPPAGSDQMGEEHQLHDKRFNPRPLAGSDYREC